MMTKCLLISLLSISSVCLIGAEVTFPEKEWQEASPDSQGIDAKKLETAMSYLDNFCSEQGNSQAMLIRNGYVVWQGKDIYNKHLVWSCSKSVMSMCFGLCWDDGLLTPDTFAKEFMPELAAEYPLVQLKHLGAMTSGLEWQKDKPFVAAPPQHPPGTHYHYNASQPNTLSYICTKASGKAMRELFTQRIAEPLQMDPAGWSWGTQAHPDGTLVNGGAGRPGVGVEMNASNMARLGWFLANKGRWNGKQLLSESFIDYATHSHWQHPAIKSYDEAGWYTSITGTYGFLFWTNGVRPDGNRMWPHATENTFAIQGNRNNICIVVPEWNLVLVRLGTDKNINTDLYDGVLMTLKDAMNIRDW